MEIKEIVLTNLVERLNKLHKYENEINLNDLGVQCLDNIIKIHQEEDKIIDILYCISNDI